MNQIAVFVATMTAVIWTLRSAEAHDLWLVPESQSISHGSTIRLFAHTGMKFPESLSAVAAERVDGAFVVDASGRRELSAGTVQGKSLVFDALYEAPGVALAAVSIKPNFIHIGAADFNEYLKLDGLPQMLELRKEKGLLEEDGREVYAKFAKAILRVGEGGPTELATKPAGLRIEIVPLEDPYRSAGGSLPVQVLFEKKPLEGVYVYRLFEDEDQYVQGFVTDADGKTALPIDRSGLWSLHCIYMRPHSEKVVADWESFFATTSFVVK